jgi:hypothetical protein
MYPYTMDSEAKLGLPSEPTSRLTIPWSRETKTRPSPHGRITSLYPPSHWDYPDFEQYRRAVFEHQEAMRRMARARHEVDDVRSFMERSHARPVPYTRVPSASLPHRPGPSPVRPRYSDGTFPNDTRDPEHPQSWKPIRPMFLGPSSYAQNYSTEQEIARTWDSLVRQSSYTRELPPSGFLSTQALEPLSRREQNHPRSAEQESLDREKLKQRLARLHDHRVVVAPEHDPLRQMTKHAVNSAEQVQRKATLVETATPLAIWRASITQFLNKLTLQTRPINEDREKGSSSDTATNTPSSAADGGIVDDENSKKPHSVVGGLSENAEDLPLFSQTPVATFIEARTGLERLRPDIRSFDDGIEDDLPARGSSDSGTHGTPLSSSKDIEPEGTSDGCQHRPCPKGSQAGSQEALGSTSTGNGPDDQELGRSGSKRRRVDNNNAWVDNNGARVDNNGARVDNNNEGRSHTTVKTKRKRSRSNGEQLLIFCFRNDTQNPCLGTDKSICEVID